MTLTLHIVQGILSYDKTMKAMFIYFKLFSILAGWLSRTFHGLVGWLAGRRAAWRALRSENDE